MFGCWILFFIVLEWKWSFTYSLWTTFHLLQRETWIWHLRNLQWFWWVLSLCLCQVLTFRWPHVGSRPQEGIFLPVFDFLSYANILVFGEISVRTSSIIIDDPQLYNIHHWHSWGTIFLLICFRFRLKSTLSQNTFVNLGLIRFIIARRHIFCWHPFTRVCSLNHRGFSWWTPQNLSDVSNKIKQVLKASVKKKREESRRKLI